ncbi:MAG: hypothetical protein EBT50_01170 [Verrucomicrobia bacterium]|nr:hypothetical protein [Verrucomicrobiota bacterium]
MKGQGALSPDLFGEQDREGWFQGVRILFGRLPGGEVDGSLGELKLGVVKGIPFLVLAFFAAYATAQTTPVGLSDLPSAESKPKLPGMDEAAPAPDFSGVSPADSPSTPQVRPPAVDPGKKKTADDSDWAAQAMLQKKEEAKKKEEEQALQAKQQARDSQQDLEKEKKEKEQQAKASSQPSVAKAAVPGFGEADTQKLPVVTGLDGVKPRAMASGDGRVQPGFDSFTGPSGTGPLGKDFQSGAKPIMPGTASTDGRMQVAPQPPSGSYKRISQDPNTYPPGYGEKKPVAPPSAPKPVAIPPNPPTGDPKRVIDDTKAGLSPYDNTKKVPDPRSQRRF